MPIKELKTNFVGGEQDPLLKQRSDVKAYHNGAELMRNVIVLPQGGARSRPGSRYLWTVPEIPDEDGGGLSDVRMFEFQFSTDQTYLFVFHHKAVTIFRDKTVVATVALPYWSHELRAQLTPEGDLISTGINFTQSRDTLIVFHQSYAPRTIKRGGAHTVWNVALYALKNLPIFDFGDTTYTNGVNEVQEINLPNPGSQGDWTDGDTFKLILEDEETDNIRYSSNLATMTDRIQTALRALANVDATGITVTNSGGAVAATTFTLTFTAGNGQRPWGALAYEVTSAKQVPNIEVFVLTAGKRPGEDVWSDARGWPRCGVFFQGRLWVAGTRFLPNTVWASRAGDQTDFNSKKIDADYGIQATTDTDDVPAFVNIFAGRHIQLFSTAAEFYVPKSESEDVTPANIVLRRTTSRGSKPGLRVFEVDGATIFVQRGGRALREFIFADTEAAYQANSISLLASHLMRDPVGAALRRSSSTEDADYVFLVNGDGTMTVFCTLRTQEVNAMTLWETQGKYDDCAVVLDETYFSVIREVDGEPVKMIELMDDRLTVDCCVADLDLSAPASGADLPHLPGREITYIVDGFERNPVMSDASGHVDFDRNAVDYFYAGLRYPEVFQDYIWCVKTLPFETSLQDGTTAGRKRRIVGMEVRLYETDALWVNGNQLAFREFGAGVLNSPPVSFTGLKRYKGFLGWDYEGQILMGSKRSTRATILGLSYSVSV